jgi:hypothetical protein
MYFVLLGCVYLALASSKLVHSKVLCLLSIARNMVQLFEQIIRAEAFLVHWITDSIFVGMHLVIQNKIFFKAHCMRFCSFTLSSPTLRCNLSILMVFRFYGGLGPAASRLRKVLLMWHQFLLPKVFRSSTDKYKLHYYSFQESKLGLAHGSLYTCDTTVSHILASSGSYSHFWETRVCIS